MVSNDPFLVLPVTKSIDEVIVWATIVCAVKVPLTIKSSAEDAVFAFEAVNAEVAYDDVPNNELVIPLVTFKEPVIVALPSTSSLVLGEILFTPKLPLESITTLSILSTLNLKSLPDLAFKYVIPALSDNNE